MGTTNLNISNSHTESECWTSTSVFGDGCISTHADPTFTRRAIFHERRISIGLMGQRAGHADSSDFGLLVSKVHKSGRFSSFDADELSCKI